MSLSWEPARGAAYPPGPAVRYATHRPHDVPCPAFAERVAAASTLARPCPEVSSRSRAKLEAQCLAREAGHAFDELLRLVEDAPPGHVHRRLQPLIAAQIQAEIHAHPALRIDIRGEETDLV